MARLGTNYCPDCDVKVGTQTADQVTAKIMELETGTKLYLMAPVVLDSSSDIESLFADFQPMDMPEFGSTDLPTMLTVLPHWIVAENTRLN